MNSLPVPRTDPTLLQLFETFYSRLNENTKDQYRRSLRHFSSFLDLSPMESIDRLVSEGSGRSNMILEQWKVSLLGSGLKPNTVNVRLASVRSFIEFLNYCGIIEWKLSVKNVPVDSYRNTRGITLEEFSQLMAEITSPRDRAFCLMMFTMGLRRFEVSGLDLEHLEGNKLWILGKGKLEREPLTVPEKTLDEINAWLSVRETGPGPLIGLTGYSINRLIKKYGEAIGIENLTSHDLRRGCITEVGNLTNGNIIAMQTVARHADPKTTIRYNKNREDFVGELTERLSNLI